MAVVERTAGGIVIQDSEILLVRHAHTDAWSFPKGHMRPGETPLATALREIKEETGFATLDLLCELGSYERPTRQNPSATKLLSLFLFTTAGEATSATAPDIGECKWFSLADAIKKLHYPEDAEFLKENLQIIHSHLNIRFGNGARS
jgi:8-oxo-dGTP pyrophosphatase MutT (NUDIX family)